jgi:septal ring factor EnvC (AmiA/AmiB activator)
MNKLQELLQELNANLAKAEQQAAQSKADFKAIQAQIKKVEKLLADFNGN